MPWTEARTAWHVSWSYHVHTLVKLCGLLHHNGRASRQFVIMAEVSEEGRPLFSLLVGVRSVLSTSLL
jgi:hypothetical protein